MTFRDIQSSVEIALKARKRIKNKVEVVSATKGQLATTLATALGKLGALIVIEPVETAVGYVQNKPVLELTVDITVFENVLLNRAETGSQVAAEDIVEDILFALRPDSGLEISPKRVELMDDVSKYLTYKIGCIGRLTLKE